MQKIQVLEEIEHIRLRKGMYIGESNNITHLLEEVLDNCLDEVINGNGSTIGLICDMKNHIYTVLDNGRGLPIYKEENTNIDVPIILCTKLFSGGKFNKENYKVSIGLNGVGLVVVNSLSKFMKIIINHDYDKVEQYIDNSEEYVCKKDEYLQFIYDFSDSKFISKKIEVKKGQKPFSTCITFRPNEIYFDSLDFDYKFIYNRLNIASIFTNTKILFQVDDKKEIINNNLETYFKDNFLKNSDNYLKPIRLSYIDNKTKEGVDLIISYDMNSNDNYDIITSVNLLPVKDGSHVNYFLTLLQNLFFEYQQKYNYNFTKSDCLIGLKCYFNLYILQTDFSSQTKERLTTNKKYFSNIFEKIIDLLKKKLDEDSENLMLLLEKFEEYRLKIKGKKINKSLVNNNQNIIRGIISKDSRLKDCKTNDVEKSELFICEGDSAAGSLIQSRDPKYHAILPLKGKVMNVSNNDINKILQNKEIVEIFKTVGVGMLLNKKDKLHIDKIRYNKIILLADADPDGGHIISLLLIAFMKFVPDVVKNGFLYLCIPPLFCAKNKNNKKYFWSLDDLKLFLNSNKNYDIVRFKGLGEMNIDEMFDCAIDESKRKLIKLMYPVDENELINYIVSSDKKRELLGITQFNLKENGQ